MKIQENTRKEEEKTQKNGKKGVNVEIDKNKGKNKHKNRFPSLSLESKKKLNKKASLLKMPSKIEKSEEKQTLKESLVIFGFIKES